MKKFIFTAIAALCFLTISAQKSIEVQEGNHSFSKGNVNALSVIIYGGNVSDVEKALKDLMKKYNAKVSSKKEMFGDDAEIKKISDNTIDLYGKVEQSGKEDVKVIIGFDLGGVFLSSSQHGDKFKVAKGIVYDFGVQETKNAIGAVLKEEEKNLEKLQKEQEDLVKDKEKLEKDIAGWEEDIKKAKEDIEKNKKDQESKQKEIKTQGEVVEKVKAKAAAVK